MNNYEYGFITKCAEYGVDPEKLIKFAQNYITHKINPGDTLSGLAQYYGTSTEDLLRENNITDPNKIRAGKNLRIPIAIGKPNLQSKPRSQPQKTVRIGQRVPEKRQQHLNTAKRIIQNNRYDGNPATSLLGEAPRTLVNRGVRKLIGNPDFTLWPGRTVTSLGATQDEILRQALIAKYNGEIPMNGNFGGSRPGKGDDYEKIFHNGSRYAAGDGSFANLANKAFNPYNRIENTLGDMSFYINKDGDLIIKDVYDFNTGEGGKSKKLYGFFRQKLAPKIAPTDKEPIEGKTKYEINLGNPETWERRPEFLEKVREGTKGENILDKYLNRRLDVYY